MYKKTLLSLAVASSLALTGCFESGSDNKSAGAGAPPATTYPKFNPVSQTFPIPIDFNFAGTQDGTATTEELGWLDGASTTAQIDIPLSSSAREDSIDSDLFIENPDPEGESPVIPNPNQNVFLLALDYPSTDPFFNTSEFYAGLIDGLDAEEVPAELPTFSAALDFRNLGESVAPEDLLAMNRKIRTEVVTLDGGRDNVLRITPLEPLDSKTKYLVVVTDEVQDGRGGNIGPSPTYDFIRSAEQVPPDLQGVKGAIEGWERLASGYFQNLTNQSRSALGRSTLGADNIALTYTFSTGGTTDVLEAAAAPKQFLNRKELLDARRTAIAAYFGDSDNREEFAGMTPSEQYQKLATEAGTAAAGVGTPDQDTVNAVEDGSFSLPEQRPIEILTPNLAGTLDTVNNSQVYQGSIEIPYYLPAPVAEVAPDPTALIGQLNTPWKAHNSAEDNAPEPTSDKVTWRFPLIGDPDMITVPLLITVPDQGTGACGGQFDLTIFQHGLFGSRGTSLTLADQLSNVCNMTVAMDLPMHGVAPLRAGTDEPTLDPFLGLSFDRGDLNDANPEVNERHFGLRDSGQTTGDNNLTVPAEMVYDEDDPEQAAGTSGELFLNFANPPVARDLMRQAVVDLFNLNASVAAFDNIVGPDGAGGTTTYEWTDFGSDVSKLNFVGHSIGGILGTSFVSVVNGAAQDNDLGNDNMTPVSSAALVTAGGGLVKLLENSQRFGPFVENQLPETRGTVAYERLLNIFQATLDSVEPHNFAKGLVDSETSLYLNEIFGDGENRATQDQTVPVAADIAYAGEYTRPREGSLPAPLAGTEPLAMLLEAATIPEDSVQADGANIVRFTAGGHNTIINPEGATGLAVFSDMATNISSFFASEGANINFDNEQNVKQEAPTP